MCVFLFICNAQYKMRCKVRLERKRERRGQNAANIYIYFSCPYELRLMSECQAAFVQQINTRPLALFFTCAHNFAINFCCFPHFLTFIFTHRSLSLCFEFYGVFVLQIQFLCTHTHTHSKISTPFGKKLKRVIR